MTRKYYTPKTECRICGSSDLTSYFDFGDMPLANNYRRPGDGTEPRFPLEVMLCTNCYQSQLSGVVDPSYLFSHYLYHSSVSSTFSSHCAEMAATLRPFLASDRQPTCLDIASNDGCLLKQFRQAGYRTIGVDPAENLCAEARQDGIETVCALWGEEAAEQVRAAVGPVDLVTATNVFAHVDDVHGFVAAVQQILADDGILVIEFPYMRNLIRQHQFDTIYHEHMSYFLVKPLTHLFARHGMRIRGIQEFAEIHGGTLRLLVTKEANRALPSDQKTIDRYLNREEEEGLHSLAPYQKMALQADTVRRQFLDTLADLHAQGKTVAAFGASAKGNVFLNFCRLNCDAIPFIVDDTPDKQGLLYPGTDIPIVSQEALLEKQPDYLLILAWNFAPEIIRRTKPFQDRGGRYITAIPSLQII